MISFLNRHKKFIFIITAAIFIIGGVFLGLGSYDIASTRGGVVADIGGKKISYERFYNEFNRVINNLRESNMEVNEVIERSIKQEIFRDMVLEELLYREAKNLKMNVSDFEVAVEIQNTPQFKVENRFDPRAYFQTIWTNFKMTPVQYEEWRRKARMGTKLKQFIFNSIKVTPEEVKDYYLANNGNIKNFDKEREKYTQQLKQEKFIESANYLLRQLTTKVEVKSYLEQIEKNNKQS